MLFDEAYFCLMLGSRGLYFEKLLGITYLENLSWVILASPLLLIEFGNYFIRWK